MPDANIEITEEITNVIVSDGAVVQVEVTLTPSPDTIEVGLVGPQGPQGIQGIQGIQGPPGTNSLALLEDVNISAKVDHSILVYDAISDKFVANDANTVATVTDGGNF